MNDPTPDPTFSACPFCGTSPRYLSHKAGFYTERVICDPCGYYLPPEKWEARAPVAPEPAPHRMVKPGVYSSGNEELSLPELDVLWKDGESWIVEGSSPKTQPIGNIDPSTGSFTPNDFGKDISGYLGELANVAAAHGIVYPPSEEDFPKDIASVVREWRESVNEDVKAALEPEAIREWHAANPPESFVMPACPPVSAGGNLVRHVKTGGIYEVIAAAKLESTLEDVTVYRSKDTGVTWVRSAKEFNDGRFIPELDGGPLFPPPPAKATTSVAILPLGEMTEEDLMTGDRAFLFGSVRRGVLGWAEPTWHQVHRMYTVRPLSDPNNWVTSGGPGENSYVDNRFTHFLRVNVPQPKKEETSGSTTHVLAPSVRIQGGWQSENEEAAQHLQAKRGTSA